MRIFIRVLATPLVARDLNLGDNASKVDNKCSWKLSGAGFSVCTANIGHMQ